ncbi:MAG: protein kinase, partial [Acidobacteria bacterium]|nr:protein kinase [Acidobacteriota bacterium]
MVGKELLHYKVMDRIGKGGMGEVYAAEDSKLHRLVALKVLPPDLAGDHERRVRFEREAQVIAALNHPNIVTVFSVEKAEGIHFLTMELVQGKTLGEFIDDQGMPLTRILELATPLADALAAAHDKGILHRDLKPDNIMVGDDGRLKVLDFGLAKLRKDIATDASGTQLPTASVTGEGRIVGTAAYMSPEQAEGKSLDARSDIFSLGIILYEMATGRRPFAGDTAMSTLSAIIREEPQSVTDLNRALPRYLGRVIKRCLAKDPQRRYGNAREVYNELLGLREELDSGELLPAAGILPPARGRSRFWVGAVAGAILVGLSVVFFFQLRPGAGAGGAAPIQTSLARVTDRAGIEANPSLSPDGRIVIYTSEFAGNWDLYLQRVEGGNVIKLTEGSDESDFAPQFSPDGERIVFGSQRDGGGIFVMGGMGGSVTRITDEGFDPTWAPDGEEILYATEGFIDPRSRISISQLKAVNISTREIRVVFAGDAVQPDVSPGGHRIAYWGLPAGRGQRDIWTIPAAGGEPVPVTQDAPTDWSPVWSPDGRFLYFNSDRGGTFNLWRVPIVEKTGEVIGDPQPVTTGTNDIGRFSISADGTRIAYFVNNSSTNLQKVTLDPQEARITGEPEWVTRGTNIMQSVNVSPDEEWIVYTLSGAQEDIFVARIDGTDRRQLTNDAFKDRGPVWSPDEKRIVFYSDRSGSYEIWIIQPDGRGLRQLTDTPGNTLSTPSWSPDGTRILGNLGAGSLVLLDPDVPWEEQEPQALPAWDEKSGIFVFGEWSPDGKWIAGNFLSSGEAIGMTWEAFGVYSLETGEYVRLIEKGEFDGGFRSLLLFGSLWLSDSRRLLLQGGGKLLLLDRETRER